jgi:hypothetical protein
MTIPAALHALPLRRLVLALVLLGIAGLIVELLLLGHTESLLQWIPVALLIAALPSTIAVWRHPTDGRLRVFSAIMALCVIAGGLGLVLHFRGNVEFELESEPGVHGWSLIWNSLTGATPTLAPGALAQLGLLGLAFAFRHPAWRRGGPAASDALEEDGRDST